MGVVYRATDTKLGREVAIKTLPSTLAADTDRLARFEREAKLLAALNHPNIAVIYDLDEHEGTQFIAMELIDATSDTLLVQNTYDRSIDELPDIQTEIVTNIAVALAKPARSEASVGVN